VAQAFAHAHAGDVDVFAQNALGEPLAQQDAAAGNQEAGLRQRPVAADEVALRDAIAVQENDIVACCRQRAAVARHGGAKAFVRLPDMFQGHRRPGGQAFDAVPRVGSRAVISDNDFEILVVL